jgi:hypothetical protein
MEVMMYTKPKPMSLYTLEEFGDWLMEEGKTLMAPAGTPSFKTLLLLEYIVTTHKRSRDKANPLAWR